MIPSIIIFAALFTAAFFVALPFYLRAESNVGKGPHEFKKAALLKITVSGICALCALLGFIIWGAEIECVRIFIPIALICSVVGDYFLQYIALDEKKFKVGILFFALTQVFLIVFLCLHHGVSWPEFAITAVFVGSIIALVTKQKWELGEAKIPLYVYVALLVFMASKAVLPLFGLTGISIPLILMAAGALLFVLSDTLLGFKYFSGGKESTSKLYLITYFFAILCIALSSLF
ncbi:MAG: lysoplasmalogenase [Coriobacteriia bacterium]|nr:lysoplasmalogenase [Coriobacteriia bacterium]